MWNVVNFMTDEVRIFGEGVLLNGDPGGFGTLPGKGAQIFFGGCDLHRNYGLVILSFLCNYDNLTLKLHQEKRSYPDEG